MRKEELAKAIAEQNANDSFDLGIERNALADVPHEKGFATIITGVRRCGKSTLLRQWAKKSRRKTVSVLFDDLRLMDFSPGDFTLLESVFAESGAETVILDEIQDIPHWERFVAGLLARGYSVFVTGSNAKMLSRELGTKLTGRHLDLRLSTFSYPEYVRITGRQDSPESIAAYLETGGFPAYVKTLNRQILTDLFNDIIYRDAAVRYSISNVSAIRRLAAYLLTHVGTRLSPSRLKDAIGVQAPKTVLEYFDHLTECCLIERLEKFSDSPKARMLAQKKVYACDTGLSSVLETKQQANLGHKLENAVFSHLRAKGGDLTYFLDRSGLECDFVLHAVNGETAAVQTTWQLTPENEKREIEGLLSAMKAFGLSRGTIVTWRQSDVCAVDGSTIDIVPANKYLQLIASGIATHQTNPQIGKTT